MFEDDIAVVIDNGSCITKAGYAGDDAPKCVIPTAGMYHKHEKDVGDRAEEYRGLLSLDYPVDRGIITDWDKMEDLWNCIYYNWMPTPPEEHPVLLADSPLNPKHNREKLAQIMFEKLNVPGFYVSNQGILSNLASGRGTSVIVEIGDGVSHITPIYEGWLLGPAVRRVDFGGKDVTLHLQRLLHKKGHDFVTPSELEIVRNMKEKTCDVSSLEQCAQDQQPVSYELPDGKKITLGKERFECADALFQSDSDSGFNGIHNMLYDSIQSMEVDTRADIFCSIILSGGSTLFPGFASRLTEELKSMIPENKRFKVIERPERQHHVWIGGSILASLSTFQQHMIISRDEYDEIGPDVVNRKCI